MNEEEDDDRRASLSGEGSTRRGSTSSSSSGFVRVKNVPDSGMMHSVQMGIRHAIGILELEPERDLLIQDFMSFQSVTFPNRGSDSVPPRGFVGFKFLDYAPIAFKCFRGIFQIKTEQFLDSMCSASLRQLENPGSSGSIFYLTHDDEFILKTVQQREADFLLKLLPGYYLNLTQNPRTLLPKFFGFYSYSSLNRSIRLVVMNNLIPSNVSISRKYDLKGSTNRRQASQAELRKPSPTYKDLDFLEHYPEGLLLELDTYNALKHSLEKDCRVLESFKIIDYSLLLAVHYVDRKPDLKMFTCHLAGNKEPTRGIPGRTSSGEEVLLFVGIIDILQSYEFRKKIEHTLKSIIYERDSISVHRPDFYSKRFRDFLLKTVFRPAVKRKPAPKSEPLCPEDESPLSVVWAYSKAKYSKVCQSNEKDGRRSEKNEGKMEVTEIRNSGAVVDETKEKDLNLTTANIIASKMNGVE